MDEETKRKMDIVANSQKDGPMQPSPVGDGKSLPVNLPEVNGAALFVVALLFFMLLIIPVPLRAAAVFAMGAAVCWQIKLLLNDANRRIKQLEERLSITDNGGGGPGIESNQQKKITG